MNTEEIEETEYSKDIKDYHILHYELVSKEGIDNFIKTSSGVISILDHADIYEDFVIHLSQFLLDTDINIDDLSINEDDAHNNYFTVCFDGNEEQIDLFPLSIKIDDIELQLIF